MLGFLFGPTTDLVTEPDALAAVETDPDRTTLVLDAAEAVLAGLPQWDGRGRSRRPCAPP